MAVGDVFRVSVRGTIFAQLNVNTFWYQQASANTSGDADVVQVVKAFNQVAHPVLAAMQTSDLAYDAIEGRTVPDRGGAPTLYELAPTIDAGLAEDPTMPPAVALCVRRRTAFVGRKYRGRIYVGAIPRAAVTGGSVSGGYLAFASAMASMIASVIASSDTGAPNFIPILVGRDLPNVTTHPFGYRVTPIVSGDYDFRLRQQRRREIGVGA